MLAVANRLPAASAHGLGLGFERMDRLFDQLFDGVQTGGWSAPWAWWEDDAHAYLEVELPGLKNEDVELIVHDGHLRLKAERNVPEGERKYGHNNRRYGRFERVIGLPETIDEENVTAEMRDGVLCVTLNKRPQAQPKRIKVQGG